MKPEDKELLLKDLCARLPYGIKVSKVVENFISNPHLIRSINLNNVIIEDGEFEDGTPDIDVWDIEDIKPYLFPLSSMTEEHLLNLSFDEGISIYDWLNKNHFDYRGLIPKGLANDATGLNIY